MPLSPLGGILLLCMMVVQLESPPSTGFGASFKFVFWAGSATRSVQSAAREVGSRQEAGGKDWGPGGRWASDRGVP